MTMTGETTSLDMRVQVDVTRSSDGSIMAAEARAVGHAKIVDNRGMFVLITPALEVRHAIPTEQIEKATDPDHVLGLHAEGAAGELAEKLLKVVEQEMNDRGG